MTSETVCVRASPRAPPSSLLVNSPSFHAESGLAHAAEVEVTGVTSESRVSVTSARLSLGYLALEEVGRQAVRTLRQSCGEAFRERSHGLLPTASRTGESWKVATEGVCSPAQPSLPKTVAPSDT